MLFPVQGLGCLEPLPAAQGTRWSTTLHTTPLEHTHPQSRRRRSRYTNSPQVHPWDVGGNPKIQRKPTKTWENWPTPHREWSQLGMMFFFFSFSHQHYNKMKLNKMTLIQEIIVFTQYLAYYKCSINAIIFKISRFRDHSL